MSLESPIVRGYRELLRVESGAGPVELKTAFRTMAMVYHPDRNPDPHAGEVFARIREAYDALQNPDAIRTLNRQYLAGKVASRCVKDVGLTAGSFFGYRRVRVRTSRTAEAADLPWWQQLPPLKIDDHGNPSYERAAEQNISILDHPSLDEVEVIFAGSFQPSDEFTLYEAFRRRDFSDLPWFVLNNEGIVRFLDTDYEGALTCYQALNRRIPQNIVFLFRLGVCHEILAFRHKLPSLWRGVQPNRRHLQAAIRCYRRAIALGEERMHMPQKCITVRKTLADLLGAAGRRRKAQRLWREIRVVDPNSREARQRVLAHRGRPAGLLRGTVA